MGGPSPRDREFGVPCGGPIDPDSAWLARAMLGLSEAAELLEIWVGSTTLEFKQPMTVAMVGAVAAVTGDLQLLETNCTLTEVTKVEISFPTHGAAVYVAWTKSGSATKIGHPATIQLSPTLRILPSPDGLSQCSLCNQVWTVSPVSNRKGIRLFGDTLAGMEQSRSEPAVHGLIQLPPNGEPIIIGPDGPTIGGYGKLGVVCEADLGVLGQIRPGESLRFQSITYQDALRLKVEREGIRARVQRTLAPTPNPI